MKKNFQKNIKKSFAFFLISFLFLTGILITRNEISAGEVSDIKFTPQLTIPGSNFEAKKEMKVSSEFTKDGVVYEQTTLFSEYVGSFYRYGITIVGLLATVMLMAGGIVWLTSTGNQSKIAKAKEMIFGSLIGMGILYSSYLILSTINPDLVKLKPLETISISKSEDSDKTFDEMKEENEKDWKDSDTGCCLIPDVLLPDQVQRYTCVDNTNRAVCKKSWRPGTEGSLMKNQKCSTNDACFTNTYSCKPGSKQGDWCIDKNGNDVTGYCYWNVCYPKVQAELGMPCGNEMNATCHKGSVSCPTGYNHDAFGGADCVSGARCCVKNIE